MRLLKRVILVVGVLLLALINLLPNGGYKGVQHPVGSEVAQVYTLDPKIEEPIIPVLNRNELILSQDTGQRVIVYIRNDYRLNEIWYKPGLTLKVLAVCTVLYGLASIVAYRSLTRRASV